MRVFTQFGCDVFTQFGCDVFTQFGSGIDLDQVLNLAVFWQYVKEHLSKHETQRYMLLRHVTTEAGRGRAWLRSTLNEHSLAKYMHMVLEDGPMVR